MADQQRRRNVILIAATLVCIGLWIAPSFAASGEPEMTREAVEQNARLNLYLTSLSVREYVAAHRRLPESLSEAGVDSIGIEYTRGARSEFELSMRVHGRPLVYKSVVPDSVFLGENLRITGIS
jgi:hypothetical protein